jgi:hypothetical protein
VRTTPPSPPLRTRARRGLHWASFAFFAALGVTLATYPLWGDAGSATATVGWVLLGLEALTVPLAEWARFLSPADPAGAVTAEGEAVLVRLRTVLPVSTAAIGVAWAGLAGWAVVAGGPTGAGLLAVPFLLLFAAIVPDAIRAVTRRPVLRLDPEGLEMRGWSLDARVAWDDVVAAEVAVPRPQRPVVRLVATAGAASLSRSWRRLVVHLDLPTTEPVVDIPFLALDDPARLVAFATILRGLPRAERSAQLSGPGPAFLRGQIPPG